MISDLAVAERNLTPKKLFVNNQMKEKRATDFVSYDRKESASMKVAAGKEWDALNPEQQAVWELRSRSMIAQQPFIAGQIVDVLRCNPSLSWDAVASEIDDWASPSTIRNWVTSHIGEGGYCTYSQRLLPLLTGAQKKRHVKFCRHLRNLWGQPGGKFLWVNYDEKWFYGFVARMAKACPAIGLERQQWFAYHKNHINKVMAIAVVAFAFEGTPENGGVGVKIAFTRAQASKIANKLQREYSGTNAAGARQYQGKVLRRKGDAYSVDTTVTGSNEGTSEDPKFALLRYFWECVFEIIMALVGLGGAFEGYTPVIQGDQAGPHEEQEFKTFVESFCAANGMLWKPQAPQMPHENVLDLAVFPCMSTRHTGLVRKHTGSVASRDVIWNCADQVWRELPECKIARAFILAWRIAEVVIKKGGSNTFLGTKELHRGVGRDFNDTKNGVVPKKKGGVNEELCVNKKRVHQSCK